MYRFLLAEIIRVGGMEEEEREEEKTREEKREEKRREEKRSYVRKK